MQQIKEDIDNASNLTHTLLRDTLWQEWCDMRQLNASKPNQTDPLSLSLSYTSHQLKAAY